MSTDATTDKHSDKSDSEKPSTSSENNDKSPFLSDDLKLSMWIPADLGIYSLNHHMT